MAATWICERQRAGPLVKECRALRPRLSKNDSIYERTQKNKILIPSRDSSVCHSRVDRLELRLALMGFDAMCYTLTFDDANLPEKWRDVRKVWRAYTAKMKRWKGGNPFDYISCIEGRHGDHRYHCHAIYRMEDFSPAEIEHLWKYGEIRMTPLFRQPRDSFRRMAKYFNKEATDGNIIPIGSRTWTCSRTLSRQMPPLERWHDTSGSIIIPDNAINSGRSTVQNEFGCYHYAWYILPRNQY